MKKPAPKDRTVPFSPALGSLIGTIVQGANQQVAAALEREAMYLKLPKGTTFDLRTGTWTLPS